MQTRAVGEIYSFLSTDNGDTFALEQGVRLTTSDFASVGIEVWSLNDPWVVRLPDGRYRMYVAALITDATGLNGGKSAIISATTP